MYDAKILADSIAPNGSRLTTLEVTFPRFILAEVNTHRVFSRNSASSRAIPFRKQVKMIEEHPFVPESWPTEQKGMSGGEPLEGITATMAEDEWMRAMEEAIRHATRLSERGVHKSLANRLIEPFMWHKSIISSTEWANYWELRTALDAQPEFRKLAVKMQHAWHLSEPKELPPGEAHLPLIFDDDREMHKESELILISAGRCARVSYLTHDGVRDPQKDIELAERLTKNKHMSPTEHQALVSPFPLFSGVYESNFSSPWVQYRKLIEEGNLFEGLQNLSEKTAA
jgi:thymidylate synthase ThyX